MPPPLAHRRQPEDAPARRLRELIREGATRFDEGAYWHAHESWEEAWKLERAPDRDALKGLIQFAAALHHWRRGALAPAARLLQQARAHLATHLGPRWPIDGEGVLRELDLARQRLAAGGDTGEPRLGRYAR